MAIARRPWGAGRVGLRVMVSVEPWTLADCGFLNLLATGEMCEGDTIHDRQHPHDLFMELAADYDRPLTGSLRWQLYAGLSGEPALGPVGFPHRLSAMPNPIAPISHHWLDSSHITFGLITTGLYQRRWKAEMSFFNGREPEIRTRFDTCRSVLQARGVLTLSRQLFALALAVLISAGNAAVCAGWAPTSEARMACCADSDCPMHKGDSQSSGSARVISQAQADSCCASAEHKNSNESSPTFVTAISSAILGTGIALPAIVPALVLSDGWRTVAPLPTAHVPKHVLLSVFLV